MPRSVRIEQPVASADTLIQFKEIKLNPQVADEVFGQAPRPGMQEEEAICDEAPPPEGAQPPSEAAPAAPPDPISGDPSALPSNI
jgi:hypothetical protein